MQHQFSSVNMLNVCIIYISCWCCAYLINIPLKTYKLEFNPQHHSKSLGIVVYGGAACLYVCNPITRQREVDPWTSLAPCPNLVSKSQIPMREDF